MTASIAERRALLTTALGFAQFRVRDAAVDALKRWHGSWRGAGFVVGGMNRQGHDLELQQYATGWWARFYMTGHSHSFCEGSGWAKTPWAAVQKAAWERLKATRPAS